MNKMDWIVTTLALCLTIIASAAATQATVLRAFVSSTGKELAISLEA